MHDQFHELERLTVNAGHFPAVSVLVNLAKGWRAGVALMMCLGDFETDYVIVPPEPEPAEHKIIGVHGGNSWLPALRWQEVLALADAIRPITEVSWARGVLLFFPACIPGNDHKGEVLSALRDAWSLSGLAARHVDEWIERIVSCQPDDPWQQDPAHGWVCAHKSSLRNPYWIDRHHRWTTGMLAAVARLFASL